MESLPIDGESIATLRLVEPEPAVHQLPAEERLNALAGHLNAVNAAIVDVVADAMATDAWSVDGIRSPQHWLCWQLGLTTVEAQRLINLAKARETHPVVSSMFDAGQLSMTQATIATSVDPTRDSEVAELVAACTVPRLRTFAKAMRHSDDHGRKRRSPTVNRMRRHQHRASLQSARRSSNSGSAKTDG